MSIETVSENPGGGGNGGRFPYKLKTIRITNVKSWLLPEMFRWQWAVEYDWANEEKWPGKKHFELCENRDDARHLAKVRRRQNWKNVKIKRRRVERKWEIYHD
jgi:hypothetical protein